MNLRELLHTLAAVASAVAVGALVIPGVPTETVVAIAAIIAFALNTYLGKTTSGVAKAPPEV